jgi:hypothetical protein
LDRLYDHGLPYLAIRKGLMFEGKIPFNEKRIHFDLSNST